MTFKSTWEKTDQQVEISSQTLRAMVDQAFPGSELASYEVIQGGCANLNIKIHLVQAPVPHILRIYKHDKDAAFREKNLADLLRPSLPIPQVLYGGEYDVDRFAVLEYMPGVTLRDVLLTNTSAPIESLMIQAGRLLGRLHDYRFSAGGYFNPDLTIKPFKDPEDSLTAFALSCLEHPMTITHIGPLRIERIRAILGRHQEYFPSIDDNHLVHGDYDPANILVDRVTGEWKISAVLDWEFAFSGPWIVDVSNMLRYAHQMPPAYKNGFLKGVEEAGLVLPNQWQTTVHLSNLIAILDCLVRPSANERPNQCIDISDLISYIIHQLEKDHVKVD
jgi:Phosphotransferase enzyme family